MSKYDYEFKRLKKRYVQIRDSNLTDEKKKQLYGQINEEIKKLKKKLIKTKRRTEKEPKNEFVKLRKEFEDR